MVLRFMLVGLVASLGFELPTGAEMARLARSGQVWVTTQWQDLKGSVAGEAALTATDGEDAEETVEAVATIPSQEAVIRQEADAPAFAAATTRHGDSATIEVVEEVAEEAVAASDVGFEAVVGEMASTFATEAATPEAPEFVAAVNPAAIADTPAPDMAFAMNLQYDGIDDALPGEVEAAPLPSEPRNRTVGQGERLGVAVRLTGQAFHAWMSVLQQSMPSVN